MSNTPLITPAKQYDDEYDISYLSQFLMRMAPSNGSW